MAVMTVPPPLQEVLGEPATASLVDLLRQVEGDQEERREVQKEHLFQLLEERFLRHVAQSESRIRKDLGEEISRQIAAVRKEVGEQISSVRHEIGDVRKEITAVRKEVAAVRKEITVQTRWILSVLVGAAVLIPLMQRVLEALIP